MHNKTFLVKNAIQKHIISDEIKGAIFMNKIIKILIKEAIHNNILIHTKINAGEKYIVFNKQGKEILSITNGWAINHYNIAVNKKNLLSVKWDETNSKPLDKDQKDMLDIINACKDKIDLQETVKTMNTDEFETATFLQQSLCSTQN